MTDDEKIAEIITSLRQNALADIKRASNGGSTMGAFILCSCLIDAMAGFIKGENTTGEDYRCFVCTYMPAYDKYDMYANLRCKLVHSYSEGGSYWFTDGKPGLHQTKDANGKTIVNLEDFIADIESALSRYSTQLNNSANTPLRAHAVKRFDANGVIRIVSVQISPISGSLTLGVGVAITGTP